MVTVLEYVMCKEKPGAQEETSPRGEQQPAKRQRAEVETQ